MAAPALQVTPDAARAARTAAKNELAIRFLSAFVRRMWPNVEPGKKLVWGWHLDLICKELERVTFGEVIPLTQNMAELGGWETLDRSPAVYATPGVRGAGAKGWYDHGPDPGPGRVRLYPELGMPVRDFTHDLVICIPPGFMKSLLVSVFWPAWHWLHYPEARTIYVSNAEDLSKRDSRRTRGIIQSKRYRELVLRHMLNLHRRGDGVDRSLAYRMLLANGEEPVAPWGFKSDQNEVINFGNSVGGHRQCKTMRSNILGARADGIVVDDPVDAKDVVLGSAMRQAERMEEVTSIYDNVLSSRLNEKARRRPDGTGGYFRVLVMQRLHEQDLAGVLHTRPGYRSLMLSQEYDPEWPYNHPDDPRTMAGQLLDPTRFDRATVMSIKTWELGTRHFAAQHNQRPVPASGGTFSPAWFLQTYREHPGSMWMDEWALTLDASGGGKSTTSSFACIQAWGRRGWSDFYVLDQMRGRWSLPETLDALRLMMVRWPRAVSKFIEEKVHGKGVVEMLQGEVPGIIGIDPRASKEARAEVASVFWRAGNVWVPMVQHAPWLPGYIEEHCKFPAAPNDDQVDTSSQLLIHWSHGRGTDAAARVKRMQEAWTQ